MNKIEEAIIGWWGERCPDYAPGCPCCDAWAEYDAMRGGGWQPIETAPKDGTPMLIYAPITENGPLVYGQVSRDDEGGWWCGVTFDPIDAGEATHWMSRPEPPS